MKLRRIVRFHLPPTLALTVLTFSPRATPPLMPGVQLVAGFTQPPSPDLEPQGAGNPDGGADAGDEDGGADAGVTQATGCGAMDDRLAHTGSIGAGCC